MVQGVEIAYGVGWAAFWIYWLIAAVSVKHGRISWGRNIGARVIITSAVVLFVRIGAFRHASLSTSPLRAGIGLPLFAAGLAFAVWARLHIGRNWGTPMTRKDEPELVTSGPYRLVRHPIYSGILVGGIGTAVGLGWPWIIAVALMGAYFVYSATVEERFMAKQFPQAYPAYKPSTKMLVPFVF